MRYLLILLLTIIQVLSAEVRNELEHESSPYLQQHKSNPIKWFPWGEEAFLKAKQENKAVFLSIGYSTCHWCHVMAKESFENEKIAELFNDYFICIKVDREEMPHLDSYYQKLHQKLRNRTGGWPLSAFLTADKKPFYVATYIPKTKKPYHEGLDTLLPRIFKEYRDDNKAVQKKIDAVELVMSQPLRVLKNKDTKISTQTLIDSINHEYDNIYKGFGRGRKFPEASKISLMMDLAILEKDTKLEKKVYDMLDVMALRGLYDHIEGGFFRYVVDAAWEIPHFEKMLYNQAELIPLYVRAYLKTNKELYKNVVTETIAALDKRFVHKNLYYSASDADTHHEEGAFFLYTPKEVKSALKDNKYKEEIEESLEFTIEGNFEDKVHLNFYTDDRPRGFNEFREKLLKKRNITEYPFIDKKINTAWNALMIEALYEASLIDIKYARKADKHLDALKEFMFDKGELFHQSLLDIKPNQKGLLEDYSFLISALISGYEVDYNTKKLDFAEYLLMLTKDKFYKDSQWFLADDALNIKADLKDKYYTSPLGKMAQNLILIASLKESFEYEELAIATLESLNTRLEKAQANAPSSAIAFMMQKMGVVTLKNRKEKLQANRLEIKNINYPYLLTKKTETNSKEEYLACTMRSCFAINKELGFIIKETESYIRK